MNWARSNGCITWLNLRSACGRRKTSDEDELADLLEAALQLGPVPPDQNLLLLPLGPLVVELLRGLHPEGVQVLTHLGRGHRVNGQACRRLFSSHFFCVRDVTLRSASSSSLAILRRRRREEAEDRRESFLDQVQDAGLSPGPGPCTESSSPYCSESPVPHANMAATSASQPGAVVTPNATVVLSVCTAFTSCRRSGEE
ncbi:hypothetical protein EYF80_044227 [Liparis tanakae]|uniref:Uncharacterized protein n=1 Tax=Liparis tanakae TaxID=230148 RepID=A0A4Z2FXH8_9TELE|nr:hypothetical protein EYF80_044227 [Liparis tanakae]